MNEDCHLPLTPNSPHSTHSPLPFLALFLLSPFSFHSPLLLPVPLCCYKTEHTVLSGTDPLCASASRIESRNLELGNFSTDSFAATSLTQLRGT